MGVFMIYNLKMKQKGFENVRVQYNLSTRETIVFAGSPLAQENKGTSSSYKKFREELKKEGIIDGTKFLKNYIFVQKKKNDTSLSFAAAVILNRKASYNEEFEIDGQPVFQYIINDFLTKENK